jgi:serine/threonine protein kinase
MTSLNNIFLTTHSYLITTHQLGSNSSIHLGIHEPTQQLVAIKLFPKKTINKATYQKTTLIHSYLSRIKEPIVAKLYDHFEDEHYFYHVIEYVADGDLSGYIAKNKGLKEYEAANIFLELVRMVQVLQGYHVFHGDLKLDNVLVVLNDEGNVKQLKLTDFDFSEWTMESNEMEKICGTPHYLAPEMISMDFYDCRFVDVWCLGVVLYAMVHCSFPFMVQSGSLYGIESLYNAILYKSVIVKDNLSVELKDLLNLLLKKKPLQRITLNEILNHPWFRLFRDSGKKSNTDLPLTLCHWLPLSYFFMVS